MLKQVIEKCRGLGVYETRNISDEYCEIVFYNKEIDKWYRLLTDIMGAAVKSPETKPTEEDIRLTANYGGIYANQTLFKKELDHSTIIAMFWPWGNGIFTTLKAAVLKK